jgi:hypothetical protein
MVVHRGLGFLIKLAWIGVRTIVPWLWFFILLAVELFLVAVASLIVGIPQATHNMALEIQNKFFRGAVGRRTAYARHVYWTARVMAIGAILLSWICYSFATVFVVMSIM